MRISPQSIEYEGISFPNEFSEAFVSELQAGAKTPRTGWINHGIARKDAETIGQHQEKCAFAAEEFASQNVRLSVATFRTMLEYHDFLELPKDGRDFTPGEVTKEEKRAHEQQVLYRIRPQLGKHYSWIKKLLDEYDEGVTYQAKAAKDIDKLCPSIQVLQYEVQGYKGLDEFFESTKRKLQLQFFQEILAILLEREFQEETHAYYRYFMLIKYGTDRTRWREHMQQVIANQRTT